MKAVEFIRKFGWDYANAIVIACENGFLEKTRITLT